MAYRSRAVVLQPASQVLVNGSFEQSCMTSTTSCTAQVWNYRRNSSGWIFKIGHILAPSSRKSFQRRRHGWKISFALDTGGIPNPNGQEGPSGDTPNLGRTRLGRIVSSGGRQFLDKLNSARKNFPMKLFLLLLGFYTANALATILGQTGDWDVLVAGVVVAAIEGIGALMYRKPPTLPIKRFQSFVGMVNYWKAGVCLGLFVDAFKLGS